MSRLTSDLNEIVSQIREYANTPEGQITANGITNMASMAICGLLLSKFFPGKATFWRGLSTGIYAVAIQTSVGVTVARQQQFNMTFAKATEKVCRNSSEREVAQLRNEIAELQNRLAEAEEAVRQKGEDYIRAAGSWKTNMDGTMKHVYELRDENAKLRSNLEEVRKERNCLLATEKELVRQRDELQKYKNDSIRHEQVIESAIGYTMM